MSVLIDSSVWSLGLRRRKRNLNRDELRIFYAWEQILINGDAAIIGLIRKEVLSGVTTKQEFDSIQHRLAFTPDLPLDADTYILAAAFFNTCRAAGVSPGTIDMTICAAAHVHDTPIFSCDPDFAMYSKHLPIRLYEL